MAHRQTELLVIDAKRGNEGHLRMATMVETVRVGLALEGVETLMNSLLSSNPRSDRILGVPIAKYIIWI